MKVLVYQGSNEQYRWRWVDDEDQMVEQSGLFETEEEALADAQRIANENDGEVENRVEHTEESEE